MLNTLAYLWVDDVDTVADEFGVPAVEQPWVREVELIDPDENRLRIATPPRPERSGEQFAARRGRRTT